MSFKYFALVVTLFASTSAQAFSKSELIPLAKADAQIFVDRQYTPREVDIGFTNALFEPKVGCYLGAYIDFDNTLTNPVRDQNGTKHFLPHNFEKAVQKSHAMYFFYLGYGRKLPMNWVKELARQNKFVHIALEPNGGLEEVNDDDYLHRLAQDMHDSGAKIFLRFASEMNGDWTRYSKSPSEYRRKFRLVHKVMKKYAPNVATVWCPYTFPRTNLPSYYPGDDGTDWVGVNMYNVTFHNNDLKAPAFQEHPCDLLNQVYRLYSKRKPVMICEYGVTHFSKAENKQRPDYAILKLLTLYKAIPKLYPRVKCINYFDGNAIAYAGDRASNDYCVTNNAQVMSAYQSAISQPFYLTQPQGEDALAPSVPTHLRDGQRLTGKVKLSCYARAPSDRVAVQFIVDHKKIHSALNAGKWDFEWDTSTVSPGRHRLKLRVMETKNWETVLWKFVDIYTGEVQTSKLLE